MKNHMSKRIALATFMVLFLSVTISLAGSWQGGSQAPSYSFHSTSCMTGSGSRLPSAAIDGVRMSGSSPLPLSSRGYSPMEDDPFGGETIGGTENPLQPGAPIGSGLLPLLLMAAGYALWMRRRTAGNSTRSCTHMPERPAE